MRTSKRKTAVLTANSGIISVPSPLNAFGAWTTLYTPTTDLCGFYLFTVSGAEDNYGTWNIGYGATPNVVIQYGQFDGQMLGPVRFPLFVPAGVPIQIQMRGVGNGNPTNVALIPVPMGAWEPFSLCQVLGTSASSGRTGILNTPTLLGTTLAVPSKLQIFEGSTSSVSNFTDHLTFSYGPSGSLVNYIENFLMGMGNPAYITFGGIELPCLIPPSSDVWLTAGVSNDLAGMMYVFY